MGTFVIIYKGHLLVEICPNVFFNGKGSRTRPPSQGSEANSAVPMGRRKGKGVNINPGMQTESRGCRALHWLCSSLSTTLSACAGAEERQRLVTGG